MKQVFTFVLITFLLLAISGPSYAQRSTGDISINVSAHIISSIKMVTIKSIDLAEAEPVNEIIRVNPRTSSNAGKIVAMGAPNSDIRISYLEQRELSHRRSSSTLLFNYKVAGNNQDDQSSSKLLDHENREFKFNKEGKFYLWIGGSVDISTAVPGNYQGEFTLDIEYI